VSRLLLGACALRFLDSFVLILPFYTVMFAETGLAPGEIGVILASWSAVCLLLEVPCGVLADRFSRRGLMAIAQLVRCVGFGVWLLFPGFWGFLIGLMLWGFKSATLSGAFEAAVYDELKAMDRQDEYVRIFGRTQAFRFAGVFAASLAGAALSFLSYPEMIAASVATGVLAAGAALLMPPAPRALATGDWNYFGHLRRGALEAMRLPDVPRLLTFIAATQAVVWALADYWQLFGREVGLPKPGIALFTASLAAAGTLAAAVAHRLRSLPLPSLYLMILIAGACVAVAAAIFQPWAVVLPVVYVALFWLVDVNADARFQHQLRPETRATVASVKGFVMQCGTVLLMLAFGFIAQAASYQAAFVASGVAAMVVGAGYLLSEGRRA
jgi:MFS family permease